MEGDDTAYSAAKLRDYIRGDVRENRDLYSHTGIVEPGSSPSKMLSYLNSIYEPDESMPPSFDETTAANHLRKAAATEHVGSKVKDMQSFAVGLTEQDASVSDAHAYSQLQSSLVNNRAPYLSLIFGAPNTGKTSYAILLAELWSQLTELKYDTTAKPLVLSNASNLPLVDRTITSIEDFRTTLFGSDDFLESSGGTPPEISPETPVLWIFDEASTHLDARTNSREVAHQYTPLLKRFAKVNTDAIHIGHSGKDIHKELRRATLMTEFVFKQDKTTAEVHARMDDDVGDELKYKLTEIPKPSTYVDPDDLAPWGWD